ncbi:MAG TPA: ElyC/SanA/YdcF family protein [Pontiella sp.]
MKLTLTTVKPRRRPSWFGWLLIFLFSAGLIYGFITRVYSFLAPEDTPHEGVMVVEGWIHDFALDEAVALYQTGNYSKIICTGVPIETGSYIQQYKSYSEMTAARLLRLGIPEDEIVIAVAEENKKDRTFLAAVALREVFMAYNIKETNLHLVTVGPHGRRSRLLFQKALGDEYQVGITCLEDYGYEPERWYVYSQGVRKVISELIAYLYAKLFTPTP